MGKKTKNFNLMLNLMGQDFNFESLLKITSSGTGDYTGGDLNKTLVIKHNSMKPEVHLHLTNEQFTY